MSESTMHFLISISFAIGGVVLIIAGDKFSNRNFIVYYQGNFLIRFIGDLIHTIYGTSGFVCIFACFLIFLNDYHPAIPNSMILPFSICLGAFLLPFAFVNGYFRSILRQSQPWVNRDKIDFRTPPLKHELFDIIKVKPRREVIYIAGVTAMTVFLIVYHSFYEIGWARSEFVGIVSSLFFSGLYSFGVFMTISVKIISRQLRRQRNGETIEKEEIGFTNK